MLLKVKFVDLDRDVVDRRQVWRCPHCDEWFGCGQSYYYGAHYSGRCQTSLAAQQSAAAPAAAGEQSGPEQWQQDIRARLADSEEELHLDYRDYEVDSRLVAYGLDAVQQNRVLQLLQEQRNAYGLQEDQQQHQQLQQQQQQHQTQQQRQQLHQQQQQEQGFLQEQLHAQTQLPAPQVEQLLQGLQQLQQLVQHAHLYQQQPESQQRAHMEQLLQQLQQLHDAVQFAPLRQQQHQQQRQQHLQRQQQTTLLQQLYQEPEPEQPQHHDEQQEAGEQQQGEQQHQQGEQLRQQPGRHQHSMARDAALRQHAIAARQRAAELAQLRDQPAFEGAQCCALEAHLLLYNWYCKYAVKHRAFDALLKVLARMLPADSKLSRSMYLFRKVSPLAQKGGVR